MDFEHPILAEYRKSLPLKLELLAQQLKEVKKELSLSSLDAFQRELHKMAGSSGIYGYTTASDLCKQLSNDLLEKIKNFHPDIFSDEWLSSLDAFLKKLEKAFSSPDKQIRL